MSPSWSGACCHGLAGCHGVLALLLGLVPGGLGGSEDHVESDTGPRLVPDVPAVRGRRPGGLALEVLDQRLPHPEHAVAVEQLVATHEDVGYEGAPSRG